MLDRQEAKRLVRLVAETSKTIPDCIRMAECIKDVREEECDQQINVRLSLGGRQQNLVSVLRKEVHF